MSERDFYKILGVPRTASEAEIRKAYRNLARKHHPDRNPGNKQAEERFKEIGQAGDVLLHKKKRELYDEFGEMGLKEGFNPDAFRQYRAHGGAGPGSGSIPDFEDLFGGMRGGGGGFPGGGFGFSGFGGSVEDILRGARRRQQQEQRRPKPELVSELSLPFVDALRGGEHMLHLDVPGEGRRELRVRIPAGVKDGGQIRLRGQGIEGGDLVVKIHVEDHPFFRREDDNLLLALPVTVGEAYGGAKIAVPTLEGEVTLTVPKGAKSGAKLRLRGKGVKSGDRVGDLIVTLLVRLPDEDDEATKLVQELEKKYRESPRAGIKL